MLSYNADTPTCRHACRHGHCYTIVLQYLHHLLTLERQTVDFVCKSNTVMPRKQRRVTLEVTDIDDTKRYYRIGYFSTFEELIAHLSIKNAPLNPDCQYTASLAYLSKEYKSTLITCNDTPASLGMSLEGARVTLLPRYDNEVTGPKRLIHIYYALSPSSPDWSS